MRVPVPLRAHGHPPKGRIDRAIRLQDGEISGQLVEERQPCRVVIRVGRIDERKIPTAITDAMKEAFDWFSDQGRMLGELGRSEIRLERGPGRPVLINEGCVGCATRQGLDPQRSTACEQVEHRAAQNNTKAPESVERGLPHPIRSRSGDRSLRRDQPSATGRS